MKIEDVESSKHSLCSNKSCLLTSLFVTIIAATGVAVAVTFLITFEETNNDGSSGSPGKTNSLLLGSASAKFSFFENCQVSGSEFCQGSGSQTQPFGGGNFSMTFLYGMWWFKDEVTVELVERSREVWDAKASIQIAHDPLRERREKVYALRYNVSSQQVLHVISYEIVDEGLNIRCFEGEEIGSEFESGLVEEMLERNPLTVFTDLVSLLLNPEAETTATSFSTTAKTSNQSLFLEVEGENGTNWIRTPANKTSAPEYIYANISMNSSDELPSVDFFNVSCSNWFELNDTSLEKVALGRASIGISGEDFDFNVSQVLSETLVQNYTSLYDQYLASLNTSTGTEPDNKNATNSSIGQNLTMIDNGNGTNVSSMLLGFSQRRLKFVFNGAWEIQEKKTFGGVFSVSAGLDLAPLVRSVLGPGTPASRFELFLATPGLASTRELLEELVELTANLEAVKTVAVNLEDLLATAHEAIIFAKQIEVSIKNVRALAKKVELVLLSASQFKLAAPIFRAIRMALAELEEDILPRYKRIIDRIFSDRFLAFVVAALPTLERAAFIAGAASFVTSKVIEPILSLTRNCPEVNTFARRVLNRGDITRLNSALDYVRDTTIVATVDLAFQHLEELRSALQDLEELIKIVVGLTQEFTEGLKGRVTLNIRGPFCTQDLRACVGVPDDLEFCSTGEKFCSFSYCEFDYPCGIGFSEECVDVPVLKVCTRAISFTLAEALQKIDALTESALEFLKEKIEQVFGEIEVPDLSEFLPDFPDIDFTLVEEQLKNLEAIYKTFEPALIKVTDDALQAVSCLGYERIEEIASTLAQGEIPNAVKLIELYEAIAQCAHLSFSFADICSSDEQLLCAGSCPDFDLESRAYHLGSHFPLEVNNNINHAEMIGSNRIVQAGTTFTFPKRVFCVVINYKTGSIKFSGEVHPQDVIIRDDAVVIPDSSGGFYLAYKAESSTMMLPHLYVQVQRFTGSGFGTVKDLEMPVGLQTITFHKLESGRILALATVNDNGSIGWKSAVYSSSFSLVSGFRSEGGVFPGVVPLTGSLYAEIDPVNLDRILVYSAQRNFRRSISIPIAYNTISGLGDGDGVILTQYSPFTFIRAYRNGGTRFTSQLPAASCGAITISTRDLILTVVNDCGVAPDLVVFDKTGSQIHFEIDVPCNQAKSRFSYVTNDFFFACGDAIYAFYLS